MSDNLGFPDEWKVPPPKLASEPDRKLHRVFVTVSIPLALDTLAPDGQAAWDVVAQPENRELIAKRLQQLTVQDLKIVMELQGFVEELTDESAQVPPAGTIFATNEEEGGRVITPRPFEPGGPGGGLFG